MSKGRNAPPSSRMNAMSGSGARSAQVVAVANQKGGVAKTTTVASLVAVLHRSGRRFCWWTSTRRPA